MTSRRIFIKSAITLGAYYGLGLNSFSELGSKLGKKLTILHTNDTHCRLDGFHPNDPKYPSTGGFSRLSALVNEVRYEEKNVLLFDAGDFSQGTPYYNFFKAEPILKVMSQMKYDASTIGNHELDNGYDAFVKDLEFANFPIINSNYDLSKTPLKNKISAYKIFNIEGIKIGVFGLGVELAGLVKTENIKDLIYLNPLSVAKELSQLLKHKYKCDLIICLSHLGLKYNNSNPSDIFIAKNTNYIDLIIGGHTHDFLHEATIVINSAKKQTFIVQSGWGGNYLGRIDYIFTTKNNRRFFLLYTQKKVNSQ